MRTLKIVKIGGKLIEDEVRLSAFLNDFVKIKDAKILIHGGGNKATEISEKLGIETKMVDGRRITSKAAMNVISMVYGGLINKNMVAQLQNKGVEAVGLCGADARVVVSRKRPVKEIDYGMVGDVISINSNFIIDLIEKGITPVFSAISFSEDGELLNTNADSVASEIAISMSKNFETELFYVFEKKGVLIDPEDEESIVEEIDQQAYVNLMNRNIISDGMLPKLQNCFHALEKGVKNIKLGNSDLLKKDSIHTKIMSS